MKILILGCGQVGSAVAKSLAQQPNNDVTVIDINAASIQRLSDSLDIQTLIGSCTSPHILQAAQIEDCDLLLALTGHDETNLVACQLASRLYNTPESIARVRQAELVNAIATSDEDEDEGEADLQEPEAPLTLEWLCKIHGEVAKDEALEWGKLDRKSVV